MIRCKIDVTKIDKARLFKGEKGTYLDITLIERHGDKYGNDFMVVQDIGKEAREAGEKGNILGNGKLFKRSDAPAQEAPRSDEGGDASVPF